MARTSVPLIKPLPPAPPTAEEDEMIDCVIESVGGDAREAVRELMTLNNVLMKKLYGDALPPRSQEIADRFMAGVRARDDRSQGAA